MAVDGASGSGLGRKPEVLTPCSVLSLYEGNGQTCHVGGASCSATASGVTLAARRQPTNQLPTLQVYPPQPATVLFIYLAYGRPFSRRSELPAWRTWTFWNEVEIFPLGISPHGGMAAGQDERPAGFGTVMRGCNELVIQEIQQEAVSKFECLFRVVYRYRRIGSAGKME